MRLGMWIIGTLVGGLIASAPHAAHAKATQSSRITTYAIALIGIPYRFGGVVPESGFDCSGFVAHVFGVAIDLTLPRSSYDMARAGRSVQRAAMVPGDLVFYNTLGKPFSHVGIYLGKGEFVHAPRKGEVVQRAKMDDRYWRAHFNGARRVMRAH
ncbi:MAG: C40 family peptidase [Burkholderiales bacterium]